MWKKIALLSFTLWVLSLGTFSYFFFNGQTEIVDRRVEIKLTKAERNSILTEMRELLKGVQKIIKAVSQNNFKEAAIAARSNGMVMATKVENHSAVLTKLPMAFKKLGFGTHKGFDHLADRAEKMSGNEILEETSTIMNNCIACHAGYKINED